MAFMATYKPGQGKQGRAFIGLATLLVLGWASLSFLEYGNSKLDRLFGLERPFFADPLFGSATDMTAWVTPSLIIAIVGLIGCAIWARRLLNKPKVADHLIGTELELRRVVWPSKKQVAHSGAVVVYYTAILALIIFILDTDMATIVQGYILGRGENIMYVGWGSMMEILGVYDLLGTPPKSNPVWIHGVNAAILGVQLMWCLRLWSQRTKAQAEAAQGSGEE